MGDEGVLSELEEIAALTALVAGDLATACLRLFTGDLVPNDETLLSEFVQATFSGYAALDIVSWSQVYKDTDGRLKVTANSTNFNHSGGAVGETVTGWYLTDNPATEWYAAGRLEAPRAMETALDTIIVEPTIPLS